MYRWPARVLTLSGLLVTATGVAAAHEVTGRLQAPMPLEFVFAGAAVTVAATAAILATTEARPLPVSRPVMELQARRANWGRFAARVAFLAAFALAVGIGLVGPATPLENFATVFVWAVWLKGLAILAAILGNPWPLLSPWRTIYEGLVRLEGREIALFGEYPDRLGEWPALLGYVLWIGIAATVTDLPRSPRLTAVLLAGYTGVMLLGGVAFGREWFARADALSVLYRLFSRVSPLVLDGDKGGFSVSVRPPWAGCTASVRGDATAAFVIATVYTVSFDGFRNAPEYQDVAFSFRGMLDLGLLVHPFLYLIGLALFVVAFVLVVRLADRAGSEAGSGDGLHTFAATVLPIAIAYEIAHFYPFVIRRTVRAVWLLLNAGTPPDPLAFLTLTAFWTSQAVLIVSGHVIAVVAAHVVARDRYPTAAATRAHVPLTILMVGYTVLSLWIVSRPFVS